MKNKRTLITLLKEAAKGYVRTLCLWNQSYLDIQ